jgi:hypothetical protein
VRRGRARRQLRGVTGSVRVPRAADGALARHRTRGGARCGRPAAPARGIRRSGADASPPAHSRDRRRRFPGACPRCRLDRRVRRHPLRQGGCRARRGRGCRPRAVPTLLSCAPDPVRRPSGVDRIQLPRSQPGRAGGRACRPGARRSRGRALRHRRPHPHRQPTGCRARLRPRLDRDRRTRPCRRSPGVGGRVPGHASRRPAPACIFSSSRAGRRSRHSSIPPGSSAPR